MVDSMLPEVVIILRLEVVVASAHVVVGSARFAERMDHVEHTRRAQTSRTLEPRGRVYITCYMCMRMCMYMCMHMHM